MASKLNSIHIVLPGDAHHKFRLLAAHHNMSVSELGRRLITEWLKTRPDMMYQEAQVSPREEEPTGPSSVE